MPTSRHRRLAAVWLFLLGFGALRAAANDEVLPESLRGVNPDMLSGGLFAVLDAEGAFGPRPTPPRTRASYADLSKGRPPAVLDPRVGLNIRLGDDPDALPAAQRGQAEPHIVRSIANPELLLATFQEGRYFDAGAVGNGYAVSHDGGLSWTRGLVPNLTTATGGRFNRATDPVAGAGPQGDLYLQSLASVSGAFSLAAVVVNRSTDGGATWSAPATVFESNSTLLGPDKNWLAVNDHAGTPNFGRLVSTWSNFIRNATGGTTSIPLVASVSDDRGVTWSPPIEITPQGSLNQGTQPVFLPDGSLAVIYIAFIDPNNTSRFSILCKRSLDGGRTFPGTATSVVASVQGWDDPELRDGVFLPSATVARQSGDIFVTFTGVVAGSPRILVTRSSDRGTTWTTPIAASDQPAGVSVMNPAVAASPDGSAVSVFFTDKRHAPDGRGFVDHSAALSFDGGATWQPNIRLSEMSGDIQFGAATSRGIMLGDYLGLAPSFAPDQPCVAIWCDTRTGDADPFTVRFAPRPTGNFAAWQVAHFRPSELNDVMLSAEQADFDRDGAANYFEFAAATNPRLPDFGVSVVQTQVAGNLLDLAFLIRRELSALAEIVPFIAISVTPTPSDPVPAGTPLRIQAGAGLPPPVSAPHGLEWRTFRVSGNYSLPQFVPRVGELSSDHFSANSRDLAAAQTDARLINLATRGRTGVGASQMIVGFVLDGNKSILIRVAGPALAALGVPGPLADPRLTLSAAASDLQRTNDNWAQSDATPALYARLGAFPFAANSLDAALHVSLGAQDYSAIAAGQGNSAGLALVEAYDADNLPGSPGRPRLVNLSTRGEVGLGDNALIAGLVLSGTQARRVLVRAIGPSLTAFGVSGVLADPVLTIYRGNTVFAANDDWETSRGSSAIAATAQRVGAFALPAASRDAALLITLGPGAYTAIVTGADGGTGIALIEIYDAD